MKKLIAMMLMLASVFFIACDDDEKEELSAEKAKAELTEATLEMETQIAAMTEVEGLEVMGVLMNLPDPFTATTKSTGRTSVITNIEKFLLPVNPSKTKNAFEAIPFDFNAHKGVYTYINTYPYWTVTLGGDVIEINFPSDETNMDVNDAKVTLYNYTEVLISEYDEYWGETYEWYQPTAIEADLYLNDTKLVDINMTAAWETSGDLAGEPKALDIDVYLFPFDFSGEFNQTSTAANIDFEINYDGATIFGVGLDATFSTTFEGPSTIKGYVKFMSVKVKADVDVEGIMTLMESVYEGTVVFTTEQELIDAINDEIDAEVLVDGAHAADIEVALNTNITSEEDLPIDILFVYSDGSSESAIPYFEDLALQIEEFLSFLDVIY